MFIYHSAWTETILIPRILLSNYLCYKLLYVFTHYNFLQCNYCSSVQQLICLSRPTCCTVDIVEKMMIFCLSSLRHITVWWGNNPVSLHSSSKFNLPILCLGPWEVPSILDLQELDRIILSLLSGVICHSSTWNCLLHQTFIKPNPSCSFAKPEAHNPSLI